MRLGRADQVLGLIAAHAKEEDCMPWCYCDCGPEKVMGWLMGWNVCVLYAGELVAILCDQRAGIRVHPFAACSQSEDTSIPQAVVHPVFRGQGRHSWAWDAPNEHAFEDPAARLCLALCPCHSPAIRVLPARQSIK